MKKILCYGDSNTFGFNPSNAKRYPNDIRWTGVLQKILGNDYLIINQGCNNRTGFVDNLSGFEQSAQLHFPELMKNIKAIDILILALGTNDIQFFYKLTELEIEKGINTLVEEFRKYNKNSEIIIVPPVKIDKTILNGYFSCQFDETSIEKSIKYHYVYKSCSDKLNCSYFDFNTFVFPCDIDGLHYSEKSHGIIAQNLADFIINKIPRQKY